MTEQSAPALQECLARVTDEFGADILIYIGLTYPPDDETIIRECRARKPRRRNVLLLLTTIGGSADAAYRIARCLQRAYNTYDPDPEKRGRFLLYVHRLCKSAGTILALGADTLILSQSAELGPIDVQLRKEDEVGERTSGLTPHQALETLQIQSGQHFRRFFRQMRFDPSLQFSTKMAAELAAKMTIGLMEPVYAQLDAIRVGEVERSVRISSEYGNRLRTPNVKEDTVARLAGGYPSHDFVIDRREARELFADVRVPSDDLEAVATHYAERASSVMDTGTSFIAYINPVPAAVRAAPLEEAFDEETTDRGEGGPGERASLGQVRSHPAGAIESEGESDCEAEVGQQDSVHRLRPGRA